MALVEKFYTQAMEEAPVVVKEKTVEAQQPAPAKASASRAATPRRPAANRKAAPSQSSASREAPSEAPIAAVSEPDEWSFVDPVDILAKLPENFQEMIASKKWQERKEALEGLLDLATKNTRLDPKANYLEIVDILSKVLAKDANINVCALAAKCLSQFAKGLRSKFGIFVSPVVQVIFEKFKEKKAVLRDALVETIDVVYASSNNMDAICEDVVAALGKQNPEIKKQTNHFLCRVFKNFELSKKSIKTLVPVVVKCTADSDPETREAALSVLGAVMKAIGKNNAMTLLSEISSDKAKMALVEKFYTQAMEEAPAVVKEKTVEAQQPAPAKASASRAATPRRPAANRKAAPSQSSASREAPSEAPIAAVSEPDEWSFVDPVDILAKLPENFQEMIESKKWQERKEALEGLLDLATKNTRLDPKANYLEIIGTLSKVLAKDANINVCALAAKCLSQFAKGLRSKFGIFVSPVVQVIFEKFKEKKAVLRDALVETIDAVFASSKNMDAICEDVVAALGKQNPEIKKQTNLFLYRVFKTFDAQAAPKKAIKTLVPIVVKCTADSDADTREAAFSVLGAIMYSIGKNNAMTMLTEISNDKTKMAQIEKFYNQIMEEAPKEKKVEAQPPAPAAKASASRTAAPPPPAASRKAAPSQPSVSCETPSEPSEPLAPVVAAAAPKAVAESEPVSLKSRFAVAPEHYERLPTFKFSVFPDIDFGLRKIDLDVSTQQQLAALGLTDTLTQPVIATKKETPRLNNYKKRLSTLRMNPQ